MTKEQILSHLDSLEEAATEIALESPHWAKRYNAAPGPAKRWFRHSFAFSLVAMGSGGNDEAIGQFCEAVKERRDWVYKSLDEKSWQYLFDVMPGVVKLGLGQIRRKLKEEQP